MCSYPSSELQWRPYTQQSRNHVIFNGYSTSAADRSRWPLTRQEKLWHDLAPALRREAVNRTAHGYPCPGRKFTSITSLRKFDVTDASICFSQVHPLNEASISLWASGDAKLYRVYACICSQKEWLDSSWVEFACMAWKQSIQFSNHILCADHC